MTKKVYLAGPMSGMPYFNFDEFFKAEKTLVDMGFSEVFNPAREDIKMFGEGILKCEHGTHEEAEKYCETAPSYRECLRVDLNWILDNADTIALLPDWEKSKGCRVERSLAECLELEVILL